jgi:hypothetical protein
MAYAPPRFPLGRPTRFRSTVHGTVFGDRERHLEGDPIGHLPPEISGWLCPWMQGGGHAEATVFQVKGRDVPSWRRVVVQIVCRT